MIFASWIHSIVLRWREPLQRAVKEINFFNAFRAALAVTLPLIVGQIFEIPLTSWATVGAFWAGLANIDGASRRDRFLVLAMFVLLGPLTCYWGSVISGSMLQSLLAIGIVTFFVNLVRVYRNGTDMLGVVVTLTLVLSVCQPALLPGIAAERAIALAVGAVWTLILYIFIMPGWPDRSLARYTSFIYADLAEYSMAARKLLDARVTDYAEWDALSLRYGQQIRKDIEACRQLLVRYRQKQRNPNDRLEYLFVLIEIADQMLGCWEPIVDLLQSGTDPELLEATELRSQASHVIRRVGQTVRRIAYGLVHSHTKTDLKPLTDSVQEFITMLDRMAAAPDPTMSPPPAIPPNASVRYALNKRRFATSSISLRF